MAKILSIVWYKVLPPVFGGQKGIANFNKYLSKHHSLVCLCSKNNLPTTDLSYTIIPELPVNQLQFINPFCWKKIISIAKKENPDYILLEHPYHGIAAYKAKKITAAKLILHAHNIESERFHKIGKWWWCILKRYEKWVFQKADIVLFKTENDQNFAIKHFKIDPAKSMIIPYGIEQIALQDRIIAEKLIRQKHNINPGEKILLFAGTLDYKPNAIAVEKIYTEIAPRLTSHNFPFKIIICGRNKSSSFQYLKNLTHPSVIAAGEVEDIENYFAAADIFIDPVQQGGGIQTKIIEALSRHCTTVCFASIAAGIPADFCENKLLLAEGGNWDNFAAMIETATGIRKNTPGAFLNYFTWDNVIKPLLNRIEN